MRVLHCALLFFGLAYSFHEVASAQEASPVDLESRISEVTVYREQADVTRTVTIPPATELRWIRIRGLPPSLIAESVRWESNDEIDVRSLRVIGQSDSIDDPDEKKARAEAMKKLEQSAAEASQGVAVIEQDLETLEQLVQFSSVTFKDQLQTSQLDVKSVSGLTDFVMQRRRSLAGELLTAQQTLKEAKKQYEDALSERAQKDSQAIASPFDVLVSVDARQGGNLRLKYRVNDVFWEPVYSITASSEENAEDRFVIQLDARVFQNCGESWEQVPMSFCTGSADLQSTPPLLAPFRVSTQSTDTLKNNLTSDPFGSHQSGSMGDEPWASSSSWREGVQLNADAGRRQVDEFNRPQSVSRRLAEDSQQEITEETYTVDSKLTVESGPEGHTVMVLRAELSGPIYRVATPLLSSFAYRETTLTNPIRQTLVAGQASVFLDGRFVGRMDLPTTPAGGKLQIGLGADRQVRTRRELLEKEETLQGGNRLIDMRYRLVVSNYHERPIEVRLYDRLPLSQDTERVSVTMTDDQFDALSSDAIYRRIEYPTGILRWDLDIPAQRFGSDAYDHHYAYSLELDRMQSVVDIAAEQQVQEDLRFMRSGGGMGGGMGGMGGGGSM